MAPDQKREKYGWIRTALAARGHMAKDVSKAWGVTDAVVSRFLKTGVPELTWERAQSLAFMLGMSLEELRVRMAEGIQPRRVPPAAPEPGHNKPPAATLDDAMQKLYSAAEGVRQVLPRDMEVNVTFSCKGKQ